jgi:hypothetical protein
MKKIITIKSAKLLTESSIKVGDADYEKRLRRRIVDTRRALDLAKEALKKAEQNGLTSLIPQLKTRIAELEELLANYNSDKIEIEPMMDHQGSDSPSNGDRMKDSDKDTSSDSEEDTDSDDMDGEDGSDSENDTDSDEDDDVDSTDDGEESDEQDSDEEDEGDEGDLESDSDEEDGDSDNEEDVDGEDGEDADDTEDPDDQNDEDIDSDSDDESEGDSEGESGESDDEADEESDSDTENDNESSDETEDSDETSDSESESSSNSESDSSDSKSKKSQNKDSEESDSDSSDDEDTDEEESDSKSKLSLDDDQNDGSGDDDDPILNPFADEEDIPTMPPKGVGGKPPREATADETIELLKTLTGEGREGAKDALRDLIAKRKAAANESLKSTAKKSLTEAVKGLRDMTDDEFGDYINSTYDLIDQVEPVTYVDDMEDRKSKIKGWANDPLAAQELAAEDNVERQKDYQKKKAREAEKARYSNFGTLRDFEMNLYSAINNQVEAVRQEYQSYDEINAEYESEDAIVKADLVKELPAEAKPIIDVYFDQSGSWDKRDVKVGQKAVASIKTFEDQGDIVLNIFYFDDVVTADGNDSRLGQGGTNAWPEILQNIKATEAKNVVIMTDHDMNWDSQRYGQVCRVDGCVWWIWRNNISAPDCTKHIIGNQGNYQFSFYSSAEEVDED